MRQPSWAGSVSRGAMSSVETCNVWSSAELGLWCEKTSRALRPSCLQGEQDRKFSRRHSCFPETRGFSFDEFFLSNSFQDLQACLTSFLSLCLCCSSCPSYSLSHSLFLIPIFPLAPQASSALSSLVPWMDAATLQSSRCGLPLNESDMKRVCEALYCEHQLLAVLRGTPPVWSARLSWSSQWPSFILTMWQTFCCPGLVCVNVIGFTCKHAKDVVLIAGTSVTIKGLKIHGFSKQWENKYIDNVFSVPQCLWVSACFGITPAGSCGWLFPELNKSEIHCLKYSWTPFFMRYYFTV